MALGGGRLQIDYTFYTFFRIFAIQFLKEIIKIRGRGALNNLKGRKVVPKISICNL